MGINFNTAAFLAIALWAGGSILHPLAQNKPALKRLAYILMLSGSAVMAGFIVIYWISLDRPPLRTLGETRMWYATMIPLVGFLVEYRWKIGWLKYYCMGLAGFFLGINLLHPEVFDKTLMPALQSVWFIPHVIVYLVGYVLLAASSASAWHNVFLISRSKENKNYQHLSHYLALLGFVLLTFGLVFGALWAKEAWGHYWTWDPKETWAFIAWLIYLGYLHLFSYKISTKKLQWYLALAFLVLLISWFGVNYLPSAANSVHSYQQS
ncbi:cytochrome c biogenesis protein CcsA [Chlorobium phaeobacteroides]|jgi:ABC-type transport system involved in cytochrome c biogenesis permease subunit|uniref:Heme exporter protein C n=1 Tax=Chlorobium phaeobacteroides (strain DSM 266 / SMG 266 / 2430) TaxID=290317 RepID=A1BHE8_CHLPD|nr:cytochrome c biogenesis protein CcsA [Chlorobium phaeobacteroides]ABL65825.1 cytochrome c assembly protein [Chlorobium phaeobacteroides DSM 266]MBV5326048.1 cytochrome c biogenesis protein CcsA [Chlorobium sp.]